MLASVKTKLNAIVEAPGKFLDRLTSKWVLIVGYSMHPTLRDRQRVRVSRRAFKHSGPARWDIVFFEHPQRERFWETKRIVGLPSEHVRLTAGRLQIDGIDIDDPYVQGDQPRVDRTWELSDDEYIVMGDNRRRSTDSRRFGPVPKRNILGKVIIDHQQTMS